MMEHIELRQGDDYSSTLTVTSGGAVADITGATLTFHLREYGSTVDTLSVALVILSAVAGTATLTLTDTQTAALSPNTGYTYEISMTDILGIISTPVSGRVYVLPDRG